MKISQRIIIIYVYFVCDIFQCTFSAE